MNVKKNILKSIVSLLLVITMLLCGNAKATAVTLAEEKNQVVKSNFANADLIYEVAYGDNEENLKGIVSIPEQEDIVPQSFSIEGNTIYILDTLNSQIKVYDLSKKSFMYAINLSENEYFIDIEVVNGTIYLYSEDGVLSSINNKGEQKTIKEIARTDLYGLYTRKGRLFVSSMNGNSEEIVLNYLENLLKIKKR